MSRSIPKSKAMQPLRLQLRAVFYREAGFWVAHCLEMDVMGHGRTRNVAFQKMTAAISLQVNKSLEHENRANIFMPADPQFFEMYAAGKDMQMVEGAALSGPRTKAQNQHLANIEIPPIEAREFNASLMPA